MMTGRRGRAGAVTWLAVAAALAGSVAACRRPEKPVPPKAAAAPPATVAGPAATAGSPGGVGREVREGEAKVSDVVKETTGGVARDPERGIRKPGPTPTFPPGQRHRPRY